MEWISSTDHVKGTMVKILRDYQGEKTVLLKLPSGFKMDAHSHTSTEQHYVLEGEYEIEGRLYGPGTYHLLPAGYTHGPFTSEKGAVVLVIWDPM